VGLALVAALVAPVFGIKVGLAGTSSLASSGSAVEALAELRRGGVPAGVVTPLEVLVEGEAVGPPAAQLAEQVVHRIEGVDGVAFAAPPTTRRGGATAAR
jgi:RND superfamily putative drug exporter